MTAFTVIGLLWFWLFCFEIGYHLIPAVHVVRSLFATWLFGKESERLIAFISARVQEVPRG